MYLEKPVTRTLRRRSVSSRGKIIRMWLRTRKMPRKNLKKSTRLTRSSATLRTVRNTMNSVLIGKRGPNSSHPLDGSKAEREALRSRKDLLNSDSMEQVFPISLNNSSVGADVLTVFRTLAVSGNTVTEQRDLRVAAAISRAIF